MTAEFRLAQRALFRRAAAAGEAARSAGLPGDFRAWSRDGLLVVAVTDPSLGFLSTVTGIEPETVGAAVAVAEEPLPVSPALVLPVGASPPAPGFARGADRLLAVRELDETSELDAAVSPAEAEDEFLRVLLAGYRAEGAIADYLRAEHAGETVSRYLLRGVAGAVAAAAMTLDGEVAVLGGASTLPDARGMGAQTRLLRHRLRVAADAGCRLAVATAAPDSVSAGNLRKVGFRTYRMSSWRSAARLDQTQ